jgi:DNA-binding PadR family transcriptional regulator
MPPGRIPTSALPLRNDVLLILLTLADEPLHGYALMQRVEEETGGDVVMQAGALYRTLRNMLVDGLVEECDDPDAAVRDGKKRRLYRITRRGRATAQAEMERMAQLVRLGRSRDLARRPRPL